MAGHESNKVEKALPGKMQAERLLIIDAHEDIAYNALAMGRDIRHSVYETRLREEREGVNIGEDGTGGVAMSGLPELRRGGFGVVFGVIFAFPMHAAPGCDTCYAQSYSSAEEAYAVAQQQMGYYKALAQEPGISLVLTRHDLARVLTAWEQSSPDELERPLGIVPLMEGADPIRTPEEAAQWYADGVRIVGLAWQQTRYSGGTAAPGPLTPDGKTLLREMERVGLILDTTHLAEESFWQALHHFHGPVIASHSNCRVFTPGDRQLSDDMIRALAERGGVIGLVPYNKFLNGNWTRQRQFPVTLDQIVLHIDHVCQLTGNALHIGIGSDIDGGFGRDETPLELDTVADIAKLADTLRTFGYPEEAVTNIMGGNWRRFLEHALPLA
ncbi:MAG: dipeptidase [Ktedonobacteraceae bacterium]